MSFTPTLADDVYTHVSFTLAQGAPSGAAFDPAAGFWLRLSHGAFGFDSGNTVQVDNVSIVVVPEPATTGLLAMGAIALWLRRRS